MTATDQLTQKLLDIINQLQAATMAHASDAMNIALASIQVDCAKNFLISLVSGLFLIIMLKIFFKIKARIDSDEESEKPSYECLTWDSEEVISSLVVIGILSFIAIIFFIATIIDIWSWVGLFNPKLYLAHEIIQKVIT
jgi:hypothetical protein